jgi:hypothetical protein
MVSLLKSRWARRRNRPGLREKCQAKRREVSTGKAVDLKSFSLPARGSFHPRLVLTAGWRAWQLRIFSHDDARRELLCYLSSRTLTFGSCLPVATENAASFRAVVSSRRVLLLDRGGPSPDAEVRGCKGSEG